MVQEIAQKPDLPYPIERQTQQPPQQAVKTSHPQAPAPHSESPTATNQDDVAHVIQQVAKELQNAGSQLQMEVDSDLGRVIVRITDGQTGQVIRQIPAQELVDLAKQLKSLNGLLIEKHA
jgi:flagellar protein FlaG